MLLSLRQQFISLFNRVEVWFDLRTFHLPCVHCSLILSLLTSFNARHFRHYTILLHYTILYITLYYTITNYYLSWRCRLCDHMACHEQVTPMVSTKRRPQQKAVPLSPKMAVLEFTECINVQFNLSIFSWEAADDFNRGLRFVDLVVISTKRRRS